MREIKFRGFHNFEGNALYPPKKIWVYGYYYFQDGKHWIKDASDMKMTYAVEDGSVGQYIGTKDKSSIDFYGGDIVNFHQCEGSKHFVYSKLYTVGRIEWLDDYACWSIGFMHFGDWSHYLFSQISIKDVEIIGSMYENPELLNVEVTPSKSDKETR